MNLNPSGSALLASVASRALASIGRALNHSVTVDRRRTCAISVECVSQKNAYAEEYKHCYYDLSHHLAPKFTMPDMELSLAPRKCA